MAGYLCREGMGWRVMEGLDVRFWMEGFGWDWVLGIEAGVMVPLGGYDLGWIPDRKRLTYRGTLLGSLALCYLGISVSSVDKKKKAHLDIEVFA